MLPFAPRQSSIQTRLRASAIISLDTIWLSVSFQYPETSMTSSLDVRVTFGLLAQPPMPPTRAIRATSPANRSQIEPDFDRRTRFIGSPLCLDTGKECAGWRMILLRARGVNARKNFAPASCSALGLPLGSRLDEVATMQTTSRTEFVLQTGRSRLTGNGRTE